MKKIIYLHIGLPKTATSSFQATCAENQDLLRAQGIHYPHFLKPNKKDKHFDQNTVLLNAFKDNNSSIFSNLLMEIPSNKQTKDFYLSEIDYLLSTNDLILFSAENLSIDLNKSEIKKMLSFLSKYGHTIKAFALVRTPYQFNCSAIAQGISMGTYTQPLTRFFTQSDHLERLITSFSNQLSFFSFNEAKSHDNGLIGFLMSFCGVTVNNIETPMVNKGKSNAFIRAQYAMNKIEPSLKDDSINENFRNLQIDLGSKKFYLTADEFSEIESQYKQECAKVKHILGRDFISEKVKFSQPINLEDILHACPELQSNLISQEDFTELLEIAQSLEEDNLYIAYRLMNIAYKIKPFDLIDIKIKIYKEKLNNI